MATSFSTLASTSSLLRVKIIQYDPSAPKPEPKSRAKPKMKTKMVEHNLSKVGSLTDCGGWLDIDAFPVPDFDATSSLDPEVPAPFGAAGPFNSLDQGSIRLLKSGRESLDRTDHATSVARTNSAIHRLVNGRSNPPTF
ncbi:hypothetical protein V2W45_1343527 [Cenococcum geophilum]